MAVYIIVWLIVSVLLIYSAARMNPEGILIKSTKAKLAMAIAGLLYIVFASCRDVSIYETGDMYAYYTYFLQGDLPYFQYMSNTIFEPGYATLAWLFYRIFHNFNIFLFFLYSIIYGCFAWFISKIQWNRYRVLGIGAMLLSLFTAMYLLRMEVAVGFGLIVILALSEKKYNKAIIFTLLALLFHSAALIIVPVVVMNIVLNRRPRLKKDGTIVIILLTFDLTCFAALYLSMYMSASGKYHVYQNEGSFAIAGYTVLILLLIISFKRYNFTMKGDFIDRVIVLSLCANLLVIPLQLQYSIMYRMNLVLLPLYQVAFMRLLGTYGRKTLGYYLTRSLYVVYALYSIVTFFLDNIEYIGLPYKFII